MIAHAIPIDVIEGLPPSRASFSELEGFQNRARILLAAPQVVYLAAAWVGVKLVHETGHVLGVDIIAHLLALVTEYGIFLAFQIAFHQVTQEPVQLDSGVIGAGEASPSQTARRHVEIPAILLHHDIRSEERR